MSNIRVLYLFLTILISACGGSFVECKGESFERTSDGSNGGFVFIHGDSRLDAITRQIMDRSKPKYDITTFVFTSSMASNATLYMADKNGLIMAGINKGILGEVSNDGLAILLAHAVILSEKGPDLERQHSLYVDGEAVKLAYLLGYDVNVGVDQVCKVINWERCFIMGVVLHYVVAKI